MIAAGVSEPSCSACFRIAASNGRVSSGATVADQLKSIQGQRHATHRIFERLRDEYGFTGGYTIVKEYVRSRQQSTREAFVPLHHPPGHAQVDFGEATVEIRRRREKVAFFCLILPHSDVWFVKAYPRETTEAFGSGEGAKA